MSDFQSAIRLCDTKEDEIAYLKEQMEMLRKYLKSPFAIKIDGLFNMKMVLDDETKEYISDNMELHELQMTYSAEFMEDLKYRLSQKWILDTELSEGYRLPRLYNNPSHAEPYSLQDSGGFLDDTEGGESEESEIEVFFEQHEGEQDGDNQDDEPQGDNLNTLGVGLDYSIFSIQSAEDDLKIIAGLLPYIEIEDGCRTSVESIICLLFFKWSMINELFGWLKAELGTRLNSVPKSLIHLAHKKGAKIDMIRVLISLYENKYFVIENGEVPSKELLMGEFGKFLNIDLSGYDSDLSHGLEQSMEANLTIFEKMKDKIKQKKIKKDN